MEIYVLFELQVLNIDFRIKSYTYLSIDGRIFMVINNKISTLKRPHSSRVYLHAACVFPWQSVSIYMGDDFINFFLLKVFENV